MPKKISVIMPTYNCAEYITDAIESVLNQAEQDVEIIIIDDGSTDDTEEVLKKYASNSIIRYVYQDNKGPGAARNAGMLLSKSEYICFIDADDEMKPDSLGQRQQILDMNEDVMLVFTDYVRKKTENSQIENYLRTSRFIESFGDSIINKQNDVIMFNNKFIELYQSFSPQPIWTGTVMIRRAVIDFVGYFKTDVLVGEDTDYWTRIVENHKIAYIDKATAVYNNYRSYLTKNEERYCIDVISVLTNRIRQNLSLDKIYRRRLSDIYFQLGYHYYENNKVFFAIKQYLSGLCYNWHNKMCLKGLLVCFGSRYLISKIKSLTMVK